MSSNLIRYLLWDIRSGKNFRGIKIYLIVEPCHDWLTQWVTKFFMHNEKSPAFLLSRPGIGDLSGDYCFA
jgi:hypothetical protein